MKKQVLLLFCIMYSLNTFAQLVAGDITFIGINTDANEGYSFITLTEIPSNEKIYFIERGVKDATTWNPSNPEGFYLFTAPFAGIACGTIITVEETADNVIALSGVSGASFVAQAGSGNFNLGPGDQVLAYQSASSGFPASPDDVTFIAGIHTEYSSSCLNGTTLWNLSSCTSSTGESIVPPGLENGTNCISLTTSTGPEIDNARYTGTLTGTSTLLLGLINDFDNWETNNGPVYDLTSSGYSPPLVTCIALAVELIDFKIQLMDKNTIELTWVTASELNNDYFTVQRSQNGINWEDLEEVEGAGDSFETINYYKTSDDTPYVGSSYYRLKQTDFDGKFEYSPIKSITIASDSFSDIKIYPNPSSTQITIKSNGFLKVEQIKIYNIYGQIINHNISITNGSKDVFLIDVTKLNSGLYFLKTNTQLNSVFIQNNP